MRRPGMGPKLSLAEMQAVEPQITEAVFAVARTAGWLAHAYEEADEAPLRFRGRTLPMIDRVEVSIIEVGQPRWLAFLNEQFDLVTVPLEFASAAAPNGQLAPNLAKRGISLKRIVNPDRTLFYFNMEDPVVGGYTPEKVALRRAIALAYDNDEELRALRNGQGIADLGERFHYYRPTPDGRILFGGYDAVYHWGRGLKEEFDVRPESFERLAAHFQATFPDLAGLAFTHAWGGAIDTSTRFFCFFERAHDGRVVQANGFTGLGVAASRFAARVTLDLLGGQPTPLTELELVRRKPVPFPPEPLTSLGINLTVAAISRSERRGGRRGPWLRTLDRLGLGFSS